MPDAQSRQQRRWALILAVLFAASAAATGCLGYQQALPEFPWRAVVSIAAIGVYGGAAAVAAVMAWTHRLQLAAYLLIGGLVVSLLVHVLTLNGMGFVVSGALILLAALVGWLTLPASAAGRVLVFCLLEGAGMILVDLLWPFYRVTVVNIAQLLIPFAVLAVLLGSLVVAQFRRYELRVKFLLGFAAGALLPLIVLAVMSNRALEAALTTNVGSTLHRLAETHASGLGSHLDYELTVLRALGLSSEVHDPISAASREEPGRLVQVLALDEMWLTAGDDNHPLVSAVLNNSVSRELRKYQAEFAIFDELIATDRYGALMGASRRTSDYYQADEPWWLAAWNGGRGAVYVSQPVKDASLGTVAIQLAVPIIDDDGRVVGVLRATKNLSALLAPLAAAQLGQTGHADLMLSDGELVGGPHTLFASEDEGLLWQGLPYVEIVVDGVPTLASAVPIAAPTHSQLASDIARLNWVVIFHQDKPESLAAVQAAVRRTEWLAVVVIVTASLLALAAGNALARPINRLHAAVSRMQAGDLSARTNLAGPGGELTQLAEAFDHMASSLQEREQQVQRDKQEIEHQAARASALAQLAGQLNATLDVTRVLQATCEGTARALNSSAAYISLVDRAGEPLAPTRGFGAPSGYQAVAAENGGFSGEPCSAQRLAAIRADLAVSPVLSNYPAQALPPGAGVPLTHQGELLGELVALPPQPGPGFDESDWGLLKGIADQASQAIVKARLYTDATRRLQHTQALRQIDLAITTNTDLHSTLLVILDQARAQLGVDAAAVLLLNPLLSTLEYSASRGFRQPPTGGWSVGRGLPGQAALERRTETLLDITDAQISLHPAFAAEPARTYLAVPLIARGQVKGVLEVLNRTPLQPDSEWLAYLEALGGQAAIAIENATLFADLERSNVELRQAYDATIVGWSRAMDLRDSETEGHSRRVTEITLKLARSMGVAGPELVAMRYGALLHDIGKMGVPDSILLKPGPLTAEEWQIMQRHTTDAYEMLAPITFLNAALDIPYCHHEKWDGTGYPRGLKGEAIPLSARIFAVADVWDALRSDRPYRAAWPEAEVRRYIGEQSGRHFDPCVVEAFMRLDLTGVA